MKKEMGEGMGRGAYVYVMPSPTITMIWGGSTIQLLHFLPNTNVPMSLYLQQRAMFEGGFNHNHRDHDAAASKMNFS